MMTNVRFLVFAILLTTSPGLAQTSRNGAFHAAIQIRDGAAKYPELNGWVATVSDSTGAMRYQVSKEIPYDVPYPAICVSDVGGKSIIVSSFNGTVEFVDDQGNVTKTLGPFGESSPEYERNIKCSIAGDRVAFVLSTPAWTGARVVMADLDGNEVWRRDLEGTHAGEIFLASDGAFLVAGSYVSGRSPLFATVLLDDKGATIRTFDMLFRYADIAPGTGQFALTDRNSLLLTSLQPDAPVVTWSTDTRERIITGVCFFDEFVALTSEHILVEDGTPLYTDPHLVILNQQGMPRAERILEGRSKSPTELIRTISGVEMRRETSSASFAPEDLNR